MPIEIPLSNGGVTLIDEADAEKANRYRWCRVTGNLGKVYAKSGSRYLHRYLLDAPKGLDVDHINGDGLDNRRTNMRTATRSQNLWNRRMNRNNTSGFQGVSFWAGRGKWVATIVQYRRRTIIGQFDSAEEAAMARDRAVIELRGEFGRLNFPKS